MKNKYTAVLAAILCASGAMTLKASSGYDLIIGFTKGSGNDYMLDIGPSVGFPYPGGTPIFNGETWDVSSSLSGQGISPSSLFFGVIGDAIGSDGQSPQTLWVTTSGGTPPSLPNSDARFAQVDNPISTMEQQDFGGGIPNYVSSQGQSCSVASGGQNSWDQQTIASPLGTSFVQSYANPNVTNSAPATLWQVPEGGTPVKVGYFTLSTSGIVTFSTSLVSTPPTPKIVNVTRQGNTSTIYFTTASSFTYSLYFTNNLAGPISSWPVSPTTVTGNGLTNSLTDTTTTTNRFYVIGVH
jgi:hypothetical protein